MLVRWTGLLDHVMRSAELSNYLVLQKPESTVPPCLPLMMHLPVLVNRT